MRRQPRTAYVAFLRDTADIIYRNGIAAARRRRQIHGTAHLQCFSVTGTINFGGITIIIQIIAA